MRIHAHACEKHLHLLGGRILRLIQNDEGVVERAAAHIGQRSHFDLPALHQALVGVDAHHFVQSVVQGTQIRIDFLGQVSGQKAQLFAGFHGRTREHNLFNVFIFQRYHGHGNGQIGLSRTCGADGEYASVFLNRVYVFALAQRFAFHLAATAGYGNGILHNFANRIRVSFPRQLDAIANSRAVDALAARQDFQQFGNGELCQFHFFFLSR